MTPSALGRFLLAALLLGWTAFPVVKKGASWRPFLVLSGAVVALALTLGWWVAQV